MSHLNYPDRVAYRNAICRPEITFRGLDSELANSISVKSFRGNGPWSQSGSWAIAFKMKTSNRELIARCFLKPIDNVSEHYQRISKNIKNITPKLGANPFVDFEFLERGIQVGTNGDVYPIVKMEWIEGDSLRDFIKKNLSDRQRLQNLAKAWLSLCKNLQKHGIAHGDLQHENIIVIDNGRDITFKLIDYDSLYFSTDGNSIPVEIAGFAGYRHPLLNQSNTRWNKCLQLDIFPQMIIYTSILGLSEKPSLWEDYNIEITKHLLFSEKDFGIKNLDTASIFKTLADLPHPIPFLVDQIKKLCKVKDLQDIPSLFDIMASITPVDELIAKIQTLETEKFQIESVKVDLERKIASLNAKNLNSDREIARLVKSNSDLETLKQSSSSLESQISSLDQSNTDLKSRISNWKFATQCLVVGLVISLGIVWFKETRVQNLSAELQDKQTQLSTQIKTLTGDKNTLTGQIATLTKDKKTLATWIYDIDSFITKNTTPLAKQSDDPKQIEQRIQPIKNAFKSTSDDRDSISKDRDRYKNILAGYPFTVPSGYSVIYRGYLSSSNKENSSPIVYKFWVPEDGKYDISLNDLSTNADADFKILEEDNSPYKYLDGSSQREAKYTKIGSDYVSNVPLRSGSYKIVIFNARDSSTYYNLNIFRQN